MNDTVARIVDLMFQELEMNDEVAAIRDEVMNNCQDRFNDLVAAGMSEDDAIAAVVESLKGMEDVLAPHKRKVSQPVEAEEAVDDGMQHLIFAADMVRKIDLTLVNEDVQLEASDDDNYHVIWDSEEMPLVQATQHNGVLRIERRLGDAVKVKNDGSIEHHHRDRKTDFVRIENGEFSLNMDGIEVMVQKISDSLKNAFSPSNFRINIGFGDTAVIIRIPEQAMPHVKLLTTSGDVKIENVMLAEMNVTTTSGDINVELDEDEQLGNVEIHTTSGDVEATLYANKMTVASTSGDVEIDGHVEHLSVNTISGDIDIRADVASISFKAISGDVDMEFNSDEIREIYGSTISGDIDIDLPSGFGTIGIRTNTRSGDVTTRYHANGVGPVVKGEVTSMSGDITIR